MFIKLDGIFLIGSEHMLVNQAGTEFSRNLAIDYLRALLTVLVVLYHAFLAYTTDGITHLLTDTHEFPPLALIIGFLDTFFMFLFFFISGLFVLNSISRKGEETYLKARFRRLGIPFLFGWLLINLPAFYVKFIFDFSLKGATIYGKIFYHYLIETLHMATTGHLWFLWVLLFFDILAVVFYNVFPNIIETIQQSKSSFFSKPWHFILIFMFLGLVTYLPFANLYDGLFKTIITPFEVQVNRILLYFLFFSIGAVLGARSLEKTVFNQKSTLVKKWWYLAISAVFAYLCYLAAAVYHYMKPNIMLETIVIPVFFAISAIFISMSFLAMFIKYINKENMYLTNLSKNAYGIYIVHFTIAILLQYILLSAEISGFVKGIVVFIVSLGLSWIISVIFNKMPVIHKIIS